MPIIKLHGESYIHHIFITKRRTKVTIICVSFCSEYKEKCITLEYLYQCGSFYGNWTFIKETYTNHSAFKPLLIKDTSSGKYCLFSREMSLPEIPLPFLICFEVFAIK